ncbi:Collagen-like protein, partial [Dysosmobacter welbionis]
GLFGRVQPQLGGEALPLLGGKAPVQAWGPVFGDQRRLDGNGAAAAEGVAERIPPPVAGEQHQGGGQRLPQGGAVVVGPVAPLVESVAGGVQVHGCGVLDEGELDLIAVPGLRQGLAAVGLAKPLGSGLFHNGLAGGDGVELG